MQPGNIKGALLEFIVRKMLENCGFSNVTSESPYSFERGGIFYVNGRGAAHDADVFVNPPIQMPFSYPSRLLFECKAYAVKSTLTIVRNAVGLRHDLNEFEIVTKAALIKRQNNHRATFASEMRNRYFIQVGVASINDFTRSAIEFAANNKIPLISLSWFLNRQTISSINGICAEILAEFKPETISNFYTYLKDREADIHEPKYNHTYELLRENTNVFEEIVSFAQLAIGHSYVGLLETGDMIFLFLSESSYNILAEQSGLNELKAEIHWHEDEPNVWILSVFEKEHPEIKSEYRFFLPRRILTHWQKYNNDKKMALNIKADYFSKIFVFNRNYNRVMPFSMINIDRDWLQAARNSLLDAE